MAQSMLLVLLLFIVAPPIARSENECTVFIVTPGASTDGSMYIGHTNDGLTPCVTGHNVTSDDTKAIYIPPADHPPGAKRLINFDPNSGSDEPTKNASTDLIEPVFIDEVNHTYGYLTGTYGIINEHQLMTVECTDYTKVQPNWDRNKRIFYSSELSNIALERCTKARQAVELVGNLIDTYGFYGTGETLIFADPKEVWVMEMCGGTLDNLSGLWVAQKVPDGEVFEASNIFRIRDISPGDPNVLHSKNLFDVSRARGWWNGEGPLDWLKTVSTGEYSHPYYSLSRVWSIYNRISPSFNLSPYVNDTWSRAYPFSVKPDKKLAIQDVLHLFRDHYEGRVFDLTKGMAAGPYGNPYRNDGPFDRHKAFVPGEVKPGAWPRPVSPFYCTYSYIAQGRSWLPDPIGGVCWFGFAQPYETCYMPLYSGINSIPSQFYNGNSSVFDRNSGYWAFNFVTNWATLRYSDMIKDYPVRAGQIRGNRAFWPA